MILKKGDQVRLTELLNFLRLFKPEITILDVVKKEEFNDVVDESKAWKKVVYENSDPELILNVEILESMDTDETLLDFFNSNNSDMISIPNKKQNKFSLNGNKTTKNLITNLNKPLIIY